MTAEMQSALTRELEDAQRIADPERRRDALATVTAHMLAALMDCQRKTADRVKALCAARDEAHGEAHDISMQQRDLVKRVDELCRLRDEAKAKLSGAKLAWDALKVLSAAGGGAIILRLLGAAGVAG